MVIKGVKVGLVGSLKGIFVTDHAGTGSWAICISESADFYRLLGVGRRNFQPLSGHSLSPGSSSIVHARRGQRRGAGKQTVHHASNNADLDGWGKGRGGCGGQFRGGFLLFLHIVEQGKRCTAVP